MGYKTLLTKRVSFSASHRYWNADWSEEKNRKVFGKSASPHGHGHNYVLETTVQGEVNKDTGMIINLYDLKPIILNVLKEFDHKHLNEDTLYFKDLVPTAENIAKILWDLIESKLKNYPSCNLYRLRLYETPELYVDYWRTD